MKRQSLLARTLKALIVASGLPQYEYARRLAISPELISRWLHDQTLPRPEHIKGVVRIARRFTKAAPAVAAYYTMAELPLRKVTPFHKRNKLDKNIGVYVEWHFIEDFRERIRATFRMKTLPEKERFVKKYAGFLLRALPG